MEFSRAYFRSHGLSKLCAFDVCRHGDYINSNPLHKRSCPSQLPSLDPITLLPSSDLPIALCSALVDQPKPSNSQTYVIRLPAPIRKPFPKTSTAAAEILDAATKAIAKSVNKTMPKSNKTTPPRISQPETTTDPSNAAWNRSIWF